VKCPYHERSGIEVKVSSDEGEDVSKGEGRYNKNDHLLFIRPREAQRTYAEDGDRQQEEIFRGENKENVHIIQV
jgi:hypothetical protein